MPIHYLSQSFNAGLLSPHLDSRVAMEKYASGCRILENLIPLPHGPVIKRPGLHYLGDAFAAPVLDPVVRVVGFNFGDGLSYIVEIAVRQIRIWRSGELLTLDDTIIHTYDASQLFDIKIERSNDVAWLVHPDHPVRRLERHSNTDWRLEEVEWGWPATLDENLTATTLALSATTGTGVQMIASADLFDAAHVGSYWQIAHRRETAFTKAEIPIYPAASSVMTLFQLPIDGQQFAVNGVYYTWRTTPALANEIQIGSGTPALSDTAQNTIAAVEADPGSAFYGPGTARHPDVEATDGGTYASSTPATGTLVSDGNNDLTSGSNARVRIDFGTFAHEYKIDVNPQNAYEVRKGASAEATLRNLVAAINLTGIGDGTDYLKTSGSTTMTAHTTVTAALTSPNVITITARTAGVAGNAITTTAIYSTAPDRLKFGSATLTGGAAGTTYKIKLAARRQGESGNAITVQSQYAGTLTHDGTAPANGSSVIVGSVTYLFKTALTPAANEVLINGTDGSLLNLSRAINLTGTPGTDYGAATAINPDVFASAAVTSSAISIVSKSVAGSVIALTPSTSPDSHIDASAATLTSLMATPTLTGGVDYKTTSEPLRVQGTWDFTSYGIWQGNVFIEKLNDDGVTWDVIRAWTGDKNRPNIIGHGTEDEEGVLRIRLTEAAGESATNADVPRFILEAQDAKVYGFVKVTGYVSATEVAVEVKDEVFSTEATTFWSEGAWSNYRGHPRAVCFHEQRLVFAGTANDPGTFWGSVTGDFENFRRSSLADGSFAYQIASFDMQAIQWLASKNDLILGTSMAEWKAGPGPQGTAIAPTDINVRQQSAHGSNGVQAVRAQEALIYVSRNGRRIRQMLYDDGRQSYGSALITVLAEQVTASGVKQMAVQQQQDSIIWAVTNDGRLIAMTYEVEQNVFAWSEHTTDGDFESVAVINGEDADEVWCVVNRDGTRRIERFHVPTQSLEREDYSILCYVDSGVIADAGSDVTEFSTGLSHLANKEVQILGDGSYQGVRQVSAEGAVAIDPPAQQLVIGLPYESRLRVMDPEIPLRDGTSRTRNKRIAGVSLQVKDSLGGSVFASDTTPEEPLAYPVTADADEPPALYTGRVEANVESNWDPSADLLVLHAVPLPFTLVSVAQRLEMGTD